MGEMLAEWKITSADRWLSTVRQLGFTDNFILLLQKEKEFLAKQEAWKQYLNWKQNRNPERAKTEAESLFDRKHGMHLIRLLRMCKEILITGQILVRRPDAEELISIRQGAWTYEKLIEEADRLNLEIDKAFKNSPLPSTPDIKKIDALCISIIEKEFSMESVRNDTTISSENYEQILSLENVEKMHLTV